MGHNKKKQYSHYGNFKRRREKKKTENIFKPIMAENFLNLGSKMDIQIHEA